jgi:hypothetical protein
VAGRATGHRPAQAVWLVLWGSLAAFALLPASRAPGAISDMLTDGTDGAPVWLAWIDTHAASALNHHGLAASIVLAVLLALVAVAVYLPAPALRAAIVLAVVLAAALWLAPGMGEPLPRPSLRRDLQDDHGDHHGVHADPDALTAQR